MKIINEGVLTTYSRIANYLLKTLVAEDVIAEGSIDILFFM